MAGRKHRQAGNRFERELVGDAEEAGFEATRSWGSNGRALGLHREVDVAIYHPAGDVLLQAKYTGNSIPKYLSLEEKTDMIRFTERSTEDVYYLMRFSVYLRVLQGEKIYEMTDLKEQSRKVIGKLYKPTKEAVVGQAFRESYGKSHILLSEAEYDRATSLTTADLQ